MEAVHPDPSAISPRRVAISKPKRTRLLQNVCEELPCLDDKELAVLVGRLERVDLGCKRRVPGVDLGVVLDVACRSGTPFWLQARRHLEDDESPGTTVVQWSDGIFKQAMDLRGDVNVEANVVDPDPDSCTVQCG